MTRSAVGEAMTIVCGHRSLIEADRRSARGHPMVVARSAAVVRWKVFMWTPSGHYGFSPARKCSQHSDGLSNVSNDTWTASCATRFAGSFCANSRRTRQDSGLGNLTYGL